MIKETGYQNGQNFKKSIPKKFVKKQVLPEGKCGHRNVLSKRQVWMSIFHIINFIKKKLWTQGSKIFLVKN
jgi:hypothetical protein